MRSLDASSCPTQEELAGRDFVDHLRAEGERRLLAGNVLHERSQLMIRPRQHLIVEHDHEEREADGRDEGRDEQTAQRHATRLDGGDLVLRGQPAEGVED